MPKPNKRALDLVTQVDEGLMEKIQKSISKFRVGEAPVRKNSPDMGDMAPRPDSAAFKDEHGDSQPGDLLGEREHAALKAVGRILAPHKDKINGAHVQAMMKEMGMCEPAEKMRASDMPQGVDKEHHEAAMKAGADAYEAHLTKLGYRQYPDPSLEQTNASKSKHSVEDDDDEEEDDVSKKVEKSDGPDLSAFTDKQKEALTPIFKAFDDVKKKLDDSTAENTKLKEELKVERDARVLKKHEEQTATLKHLGADSKELAKILKGLEETDPEAHKKMTSILSAADEQVRVAKSSGSGLFGELGSRLPADGASDAEAKLQQLVDSVVQKSDGSRTPAEIYSDVLRTPEGQRLYKAYKGARPGGI